MIALAGTLGAGLFIYSGSALSTAGPAGALIAYVLCGTSPHWTRRAINLLTLLLLSWKIVPAPIFGPLSGSSVIPTGWARLPGA